LPLFFPVRLPQFPGSTVSVYRQNNPKSHEQNNEFYRRYSAPAGEEGKLMLIPALFDIRGQSIIPREVENSAKVRSYQYPKTHWQARARHVDADVSSPEKIPAEAN